MTRAKRTNANSGDPEAEVSERAILGSILEDNSLLTTAAHELSVSDFYCSAHQVLFGLYLELTEEGKSFDVSVIAAILEERGQLESVGGLAYLSELLDGVLTHPDHIHYHVRRVINRSQLRKQRRTAAAWEEQTREPGADPALLWVKFSHEFESLERDSPSRPIRRFEDIPDIMTLKILPPEYFVDRLIARGTIIEWTGLGGAAKSFLIEKMAVAVAGGGTFLRLQCTKANVLYLDYENPGFVVQGRLSKMTETPLPKLRVWSKSVKPSPPPIGHEDLRRIVEQAQPLLLIVDPLRDAHSADENDSGQMKVVMDSLRSYSNMGTAVVIVHHVARYDGSISRGSTAIYDAMDVALLQQKDEQTGIINLKITKHRWEETRSMSVKIDFRNGDCELIDNPKAAQEAGELTKLYTIIQREPGISQNKIADLSGMKRAHVSDLLRRNEGVLWTVQEDGQKHRYYPHATVSQ